MKDNSEKIALLNQMVDKTNHLIDLYQVQIKKYQKKDAKIKEYEQKIEKLRNELIEYNKELIELKEKRDAEIINNIDPEKEKQIIKAFRENPLGREGNINDAFFNSEGRELIRALIKKGVVKVIEHFHHFAYLPNHEHYGLVGEEYPTTHEEFHEFRTSSYSEKGSFTEFKKAKANGEIMDFKIFNQKMEDLDQLFRKKIKKDDCFVNYCKNMLEIHQVCYKLFDSDRTLEQVLDDLFLKHANDNFFSLKSKSKWYLEMIEKIKL